MNKSAENVEDAEDSAVNATSVVGNKNMVVFIARVQSLDASCLTELDTVGKDRGVWAWYEQYSMRQRKQAEKTESAGWLWYVAYNAAVKAAGAAGRRKNLNETLAAALSVAPKDVDSHVSKVVFDVALALFVRDLIGQHSFLQQHYDMLIGPWVSVAGSAHPDDSVLV